MAKQTVEDKVKIKIDFKCPGPYKGKNLQASAKLEIYDSGEKKFNCSNIGTRTKWCYNEGEPNSECPFWENLDVLAPKNQNP